MTALKTKHPPPRPNAIVPPPPKGQPLVAQSQMRKGLKPFILSLADQQDILMASVHSIYKT